MNDIGAKMIYYVCTNVQMYIACTICYLHKVIHFDPWAVTLKLAFMIHYRVIFSSIFSVCIYNASTCRIHIATSES